LGKITAHIIQGYVHQIGVGSSLHLKNIFKDEELDEGRVVKDYLTTAGDSKKYGQSNENYR